MIFSLNSTFKQSIAQQIEFEGLGEIINNELIIDDKNIYSLEPRQLGNLDAPDFFQGQLSVKFKTAPRPFHCEAIFKDEFGNTIRSVNRNGCLIIYQDEIFILSKTMYEICQDIDIQRENHDEDLLWKILECAKNSQNNKISLEGLPKNDIIRSLPPLNIDIKMNENGSATIKPYIHGMSEQKQREYENQILDSSYIKMLVEVSTANGKTHKVRHIMHPKDIEAYKRLHQIGVIAKEDLPKFFKNPAPFIFIDEESEKDLPISFDGYRILGMGEPYKGYFGSKLLDSPIAEALIGDGNSDISKEIKENVMGLCNGKTREEIEGIRDKLAQAITNNNASFQVDEQFTFPNVAFGTLMTELSKVINKIDATPRESTPSKIVINIDPNDEISVSFQAQNIKKLEQIDTQNNNKGTTYDNFKDRFSPKSYQVQGVNWLIDLYSNKFKGGILADDMGLGKTFQVIAFINYLLHITEDFNNKKILIVTPNVLLENWKNELEKFLKPEIYQKLNIHIVQGADLAKRKQVQKNEQGIYNCFNVEKFLERPLDILITSYETLSNYQFSFIDKKFNWGCIIYDEAHKIKNPNAQISQASRAISSETDFNVILTGTPIENELRDLWALFDVFDPQHFGSWKKFRDSYVDKNSQDVETRLRKHASNYLLRRLKKDYLKELPEKIEKVHEIKFNQKETQVYENYRNADEVALTRLHKLKKFSLDGDLKNHADFQNFSKAKELISILESIKHKNEKAIIFIIQRAVQDLVKFSIEKHFSILVPIINGDNNKSERVQTILKEFDAIQGFGAIILSPLSAGVGLTITSANHVIHYERWWNASKEDQASDRAYRIGQTKDVYIHYLIGELLNSDMTNGTVSIDRAIHNLIKNKRETAGFLIPPKNITFDEISDSVVEASQTEVLTQELRELSWQNFENLVKRLYEAQGYECSLTPIGVEDYGADIIARKDGEVLAIQCKHTTNGKSRNEDAILALLNQSIDTYGATKLVAVTNSDFSNQAKVLALDNDVKLINLTDLLKLLIEFDIKY